MKVERIAVEELEFDPSNVREHDERNVAAIKASLLRFGQQKPIVVDGDGIVVAGNGTLGAARLLGWKKIDIVRTDLKGAEAVAYAIADNRTSELASWDDDALAMQLEQLETPLLEAAGFTEEEFGELMAELDPTGGEVEEVEAKADQADELQKKWKVERGDLWQIGNHRLLCGDATSSDDVGLLAGGDQFDHVLTSPPYNQGGSRGDLFTHGKKAVTLYEHGSDNMTASDYFEFCCNTLKLIASNLAENHSVAWNVSYNAKSRDDYGKILFCGSHGFGVKETIVWNKRRAINQPQAGIISRQCEFIFILAKSEGYLDTKKKGECRWNYYETTVHSQPNEHRATFPTELAQMVGKDFWQGMNVYDPFLGTGTTMVAAEQLNRKCYGLEIEPKYCAVILERMSDMGLSPKRVE